MMNSAPLENTLQVLPVLMFSILQKMNQSRATNLSDEDI